MILLLSILIPQSADCHPHYNILKELLVLARPLPIHLELLPQVESHYSAAKAWVDRAARIFLKKNSTCQLLEVRCNTIVRSKGRGGICVAGVVFMGVYLSV